MQHYKPRVSDKVSPWCSRNSFLSFSLVGLAKKLAPGMRIPIAFLCLLVFLSIRSGQALPQPSSLSCDQIQEQDTCQNQTTCAWCPFVFPRGGVEGRCYVSGTELCCNFISLICNATSTVCCPTNGAMGSGVCCPTTSHCLLQMCCTQTVMCGGQECCKESCYNNQCMVPP